MATNILIPVGLAIAVALAFVAWRAWNYAPNKRTLWLAVGFTALAAKAVTFAVALFTDPGWRDAMMVPGLAFDIVALGAFYVAVLR